MKRPAEIRRAVAWGLRLSGVAGVASSSFAALTSFSNRSVGGAPSVAERSGGAEAGRTLVVEQVMLADDETAEPAVTPLTEIPLHHAPGAGAGPIRGSVRAAAEGIDLDIVAGKAAVAVEARPFAQGVYGSIAWTATVPRMFAGRAATDGERIYLGTGDGHALALDARTGGTVWSISVTTRADTYGALIYGPWDDQVAMLPDGGVVFSTVAFSLAVDPRTGAERWRVPGGYLFAEALVLDERRVLLVNEWGRVSVVDAATGAEAWGIDAVVPRAVHSSPVRDPRTGLVWLVGAQDGVLRSVGI